jgi:O-antigen/teichoic acid export membrane protein
VRAGLPFGLTSLALTFSFNADSVMLGLFHGAGAVGIYNAAYRLVFNLSSLAGGFLTSMTPSLAREHVVNAERVSAWVRSGLQLLCTFALPVAVGGSLLAGRIVATLYGPEFAASGMVLAIVIWTVPFHLFNAFSGNVTAAVGLERPAARIFLTSAALNVALNLVLIPRYGVNGAAAVTVASDGLASLRLYRLLHSELQLDDLLGRIGRIVVAATVMGVVVYLASALPLGVLIPLGMLVYGILAFVLRIIDPVVLALPRRMFALLRPGG